MSMMLDNPISGGFFRRSIIMEGDDGSINGFAEKDEIENGLVLDPCNSSSSSSIGMNSDDDDDDGDESDEDQVESKLTKPPFDSAVHALEQALPIKRGISNFYNGKSKSFASLADAACSSVEDITKTENAYSRKRKNLLAHSLYDKGRPSLPKSPSIGCGLAKSSINTSQSTLAHANPMNKYESHSEERGSIMEVNGRKNTRNLLLPPVPPPPWRSFSLADLQHCALSANTLKSNLCSTLMEKRTKRDEASTTTTT